jgi:hypothetical protein
VGRVTNNRKEIGLSGTARFVWTVEAESASLSDVGIAEVKGVDGGYVGILADETFGGGVGLGPGLDIVLSPDSGIDAECRDHGSEKRSGEDGELHVDGLEVEE